MMKITEVRDGFIKLEATENVEISSFLEIKGMEKRYIAQVVRSKNNGTGYNVYAKLLFIYDGSLRKYDKTLPNINSEACVFPFEKINNSFNYARPIVAGKFVSGNENILLDSDDLCNTTLVSVDNPEMNDIIVQNLAKQFQQKGKTIIIDMLGMTNCDKFVAGRDFKLPLNIESLKFIYEDCLNDATSDSKALIKEIFADLANYAKEVKFLPFKILKNIVEDMVEKSHIFKLLVLKNKLVKFEKAGYFASNANDAENLSKILKSNFAVIDLSKIDSSFQNRYLEVILSELNNFEAKSFILLEASNAISKKNIKSILTSDKLKSIFVTHSRFKYLADLRSVFKNYIIENTIANREIFSLYSFFLEAMKNDNYLIVGNSTHFVPLISLTEKYEAELQKLPQDSVSEEVKDSNYDSQISDNESNYADSEDSESESIFADEDDNEEEFEEVQTENLIDSEEEDFEDIDEVVPEDEDNTEEDDSISEIQSEESEEPEGIANDEVADDTVMTVVHSDYSENDENTLIQDSVQEYKTEVSQENIESLSDIDIPEDLNDDFDDIEKNEIIEAEVAEDDEQNQQTDSTELETEEQHLVIPLEEADSDIGDFEELEVDESIDDDILVDLTEGSEPEFVEGNESAGEEQDITPEEVDKSIVEDVDKVFSTMKEDGISESDLDLIDTLNESELSEEGLSEETFFSDNDVEALQGFDNEEEEEGFLEPLEEISDAVTEDNEEKEVLETRMSSTSNVPIYEASIPDEDKVVSDPIEQGDTVVHAKYGTGVVEKMIKYGNKNLYSINFDNIGRRLLDPTLTEIKKA